MNKVKYQLAGQEMSIGRYYLLRRNYIAAIGRFEGVTRAYRLTPHDVEARYRLIECYSILGIEPKVKKILSDMTDFYPDNDWTKKAHALYDSSFIKD